MVVKKKKTLAERGITQRCAKLYSTKNEWLRMKKRRDKLGAPWFAVIMAGLSIIEAEQNAAKTERGKI